MLSDITGADISFCSVSKFVGWEVGTCLEVKNTRVPFVSHGLSGGEIGDMHSMFSL